jgi:capsid protein
VNRATLLDGDIFGLPTHDGALQVIEADRCRTPGGTTRNVVLGVELDKQRRRVSYFFTKQEDLNPYQQIDRVGEFTRVMAYDETGEQQVFHVSTPTRKTQTRGVTAIHAVFDVAGMWDDTNFALVVKEQIAAAFGIFFEQTQQGYGLNPQTGERTNETTGDMTFINEGISPGQKILLPYGVKPFPYHPNITTQETRQHMRDLVQLIAVQLGLPLQVLLIDPTETNFSGWRGAMDQMKLIFRRRQKNLVAEFHRPVWRWKVRQWLAEGKLGPTAEKLAQSGKLFAHVWHPPTWPYVNPVQDAAADALRLTTGQASLRQIHAENGRDFQQVATDNVQDIEFWIGKAIEATLRLRQQFGDSAKDVHWQHLYYRDLPKGDTLTAMLQERRRRHQSDIAAGE